MPVCVVKILVILLIFAAANVDGQRGKIIKHGDVKITDYNKKYADNARLYVHWYNRTTQSFGGSVEVKQEVGFDDKVNVTIYKLRNNQYHQIYQLDLPKGLCEYLAENKMGSQDLAKLLGITKCPIKKGNYALDDVVPDLSSYPLQLAPPATYKLVVNLYDRDIYLGSGYWQGEVVAVN